MPHQCVHCGKFIEAGSKEIIEGCVDCGGKFFYYIKDEQLQRIKDRQENDPIEIITQEDKIRIEKDVREMAGIVDEEMPVILDLESIRVVADGKFELDIVNLFNKKRPLVYKLEEGKYIIDLATTLNQGFDSSKFTEMKTSKS
ncbi:hypothetical protein COU57_04180 [Candidatus Pacearchaeota archaeon CG10_big_fil_rev_8_21_14_0_10_32_14]|nr:MAG: hypothetical protein COU57_04180 [Candidatus Pacearchaeota archaeon CG10_big_fil_rev_8_21_14_0_10_32_14]